MVEVTHYFMHAGQEAGLMEYAEKRALAARRHGGTILADFSPVGAGQGAVPDRIVIGKFPSSLAYDAFSQDAVLAALKPLCETAVREMVTYHSPSDPVPEAETPTLIEGKTLVSGGVALPQVGSWDEENLNFQTLYFDKPIFENVENVLDTIVSRSVDPVYDQMRSLYENWEAAQDRRVIFIHTYLLMTGNMRTALKAGEFYDNRWVGELLDRFAVYYFNALEAYETAWFSSPMPWRIAFQAAEKQEIMTFQHLLLGVNAHINFDLFATLLDMLLPEWESLSLEQREERYQDHTHVNTIIEQTMDVVQQEIIARYSPMLDRLQKATGEFDDWMVSWLISHWRDQVWKHAVSYLETADRDERAQIVDAVEYITVQRADAILFKKSPLGMAALL
jgi:hypothetical protein